MGLIALLAIVFAATSAFTSRTTTTLDDMFLLVKSGQSGANFINGSSSGYTDIDNFVVGNADAKLWVGTSVDPLEENSQCAGASNYVCAFNIPVSYDANNDDNDEINQTELTAYLTDISFVTPSTVYYRGDE